MLESVRKLCGVILNRGRILYVSMGQGIHDRRFITCASENGWLVTALRCDGNSNEDLIGADSFRWIGNQVSISKDNEVIFKSDFLNVVSSVKPDIIQVGPLSSAGAVLSENLDVPVLATSWSQDLLYDIHESDWAKQTAVAALRISRHLLADCETVRDIAIELGVPKASISIVPWGIDLDRFNYSPRTTRRDQLSIVSLRSLEPLYSVSVLLEAIRELHLRKYKCRINAVIAGSGSQEYSLKSFVDKYDLDKTIKFVGYLPESDLPKELLKHDLCVSTSPVDGSSISMLQAMASGLPCVVPDIPSNREWIEHGLNGLLYEARNAKSLIETLYETSNGSLDLLQLASNARETVEARADWRIGRKSIGRIHDLVASK
jgi:glycosyltransferase involved in cell wall biosynthesis